MSLDGAIAPAVPRGIALSCYRVQYNIANNICQYQKCLAEKIQSVFTLSGPCGIAYIFIG